MTTKKSCRSGKICYRSRTAALQVRKQLKNKDRPIDLTNEMTLKPYQCPICGFWHLGHHNRNPQAVLNLLDRIAEERRHSDE